jgi:parallel beta-helix repeat protein
MRRSRGTVDVLDAVVGVAVMSRQPAAFMSYVRFVDQHEGGKLTQFRERLAAEVQVQTGEEFLIFQDRNDIAWGQNWQARINETLDAVTLLIPVVTPAFFRSPACREELTRFLERERDLGRQDLILPVYYVSTPELDDPKQREGDELAAVLAARQYADWRELRFEPFTSPVVGRALAQLASRMRDSFWHQPPTPPSRPRRTRPAAPQAARSEARGTVQAATVGPVAKTEPPIHVVDVFPKRGDFTTIGAAIKAAGPGDRILVRPGRYQEGLVVDKPLEILGDGPVADIEVQARGTSALVFKATMGRVANLTLRQAGEGNWFGVDITQGRLELEGCDISSQSLACVTIHDGADPRLRGNRIHDSKRGDGVWVYNDGLGTLEDNDITANARTGVEIQTGNPTLRRNYIHDNKQAGVLVHANGLGTLEDNDITANGFGGIGKGIGFPGVSISGRGNPTLRNNRIHDNKQSGVSVHADGLGTLEGNDIIANGFCGVMILSGGYPTVRSNRINRNALYAVLVKGGGGVIEDNDLTDNEQGSLSIAEDAEPKVTHRRNRQ